MQELRAPDPSPQPSLPHSLPLAYTPTQAIRKNRNSSTESDQPAPIPAHPTAQCPCPTPRNHVSPPSQPPSVRPSAETSKPPNSSTPTSLYIEHPLTNPQPSQHPKNLPNTTQPPDTHPTGIPLQTPSFNASPPCTPLHPGQPVPSIALSLSLSLSRCGLSLGWLEIPPAVRWQQQLAPNTSVAPSSPSPTSTYHSPL
jgi:hypothetical protein